MALLDTTALIDLGRKPIGHAHQSISSAIRQLLLAGETLFTSRINDAEFRVGPEMSTDRQREMNRVEQILARFIILEFDAAAALRYAVIKATTLKAGRTIGDCDAMIASVALVHGQLLLTRNPRHFTRIPSLAVRSY